MADFQYAQGRQGARAGDMSVDAGLRSFMLGVYVKLGIGILLAGALAYAAGAIPAVSAIVFSPVGYPIVQFGPIVLLLGSMFFMKNPSPLASGILYWAIVVMIGLGLGIWVAMAEQAASGSTRGGINLAPTYGIIAKAFFITASAFGALSLWGYTTKRDLTGIGSFAIMALWGVVAVSLVGLFFRSSALEWITMGAVAGLSALLIAWETQQLKAGYYAFAGDGRSMAVLTNWGALNFFISFVNMFRFILMLLSSRN